MNFYRVRTEVRAAGAIGVFEWRDYETAAETPEQAREASFNHWHKDYSHETRGVVVEQLSNVELMARFDNQTIEAEYRQ